MSSNNPGGTFPIHQHLNSTTGDAPPQEISSRPHHTRTHELCPNDPRKPTQNMERQAAVDEHSLRRLQLFAHQREIEEE